MTKKQQNKYTRNKVKKDIKEIIKKIPIEKDDSQIEKVFLRKRAIKEYYDKHLHQLTDNTLVEIYTKIYNPNILSELAIGIFSGFATNYLGEFIQTIIPYNGESTKEFVCYFIAMILFLGVIFFVFFLMLIWSYKKILSLRSYTDEVNNYHREIVYQYIKKREECFEKRYKNEPKHRKNNRKHK
ncbi:MAG TPA: hypothetical protein RWO09_03220 [Ruminococcus sp.]